MRFPVVILAALVVLSACNDSKVTKEPVGTEAKATGFKVGDIDVQVDQLAAEAFAEIGVSAEDALTDPLLQIQAAIPLPAVKLSIVGDPEHVIEEVGVLGRSYNGGDVGINIDQTRDDLEQVIDVWLPQHLAHELMHSSRNEEGARAGSTLLDRLIEEGLADAFSLEMFPNTPEIPWTAVLSPSEVQSWWKKAIPELEKRGDRIYGRWFFGTEDIPNWVGYSLGSAIVQNYLERTDSVPSSTIVTKANRILKGSDFSLDADKGQRPSAS